MLYLFYNVCHHTHASIQDLAIVPFLTPDSDGSSDSDSSDNDSSDNEQTLDDHTHSKVQADIVLSDR